MDTKDLSDIYAHALRPVAQGVGIYSRQISSAHVITNIISTTSGTLKIHPNLKETAQLVYIVIDANCDGGRLF